jgi:oligopeptide/dipeptide ABC transporter ATP-binding protein
MKELLSIKDLVTEIPLRDTVVSPVDHVSFSVNEGEAFGIVGESGSGKSMTCRSILRLLQPPAHVTHGEIVYDGKRISDYTESEFAAVRGKGISMVFQDPMTSLNPVLRIGEQIFEAFDASLTKQQRQEQAVELLKQVGISSAEERLKEYPHQFSGGMRQRAMIAITLARNPRLLLADEPTTALDVTIQDQILTLLKKLQHERNMGVVFVSHDLGVVARFCERMAVMYAGQIVEMSSVEEIFSNPQHPYTIGLMNSMPSLQKVSEWLVPISGMPPDLRALPQGCRFAPRCPWVSSECEKAPIAISETAPGHFSRCLKAAEMKKLVSDAKNERHE